MKQHLTTLPLGGIHADTLGHYLTSIGVLRAAAQKWPSVRGCWRGGRFHLLGCGSTADELVAFFKTQWRPTRFDRWWSTAQSDATRALAKSKQGMVSGRELDPLHVARREQADLSQVHVFDAVMACGQSRVFSPIFGTGGNIGKRNLAKVQKECLRLTGRMDVSGSEVSAGTPIARKNSRQIDPAEWLRMTLLGDDGVELPEVQSAGTWFVFANKTFNSGQQWYREGRLSPWSFLLAMEGATMLRGGVNRRFGARARGYGVFPFMCRPAAPVEPGEVGLGHAEFWAPLWTCPATVLDVLALFRRGLARIGGRAATAPHEFAAAAMTAGVDAGVSCFARFELRQTTSAQVYEAVPSGRIQISSTTTPTASARRDANLITPLVESGWLDRLPREPSDPKQKGRFVGVRGLVERMMIRIAEQPDDPACWRDLLFSLSDAQVRA